MLNKKIGTYFLITLLFSLFFVQLNVAQKEANHWYFGYAAGLDFTSGVPLPDTSAKKPAHFTPEGAVSMSDAAGNLLFYYADKTIWNKNHVIMPNGSGINGNLSTSQALAILKPGSTTIYYLFVIDVGSPANGALSYSEIDMTLDGGLGDVTTTKNSFLHNQSCEKVTAIKHCNQTDVWVVTHDRNSDAFRTFLVTAAGINTTPVISNVGIFFSQAYPSQGYLKGTPTGKKLASAILSPNNRFELFDFDNKTGILSNGAVFPFISASSGAYGIEFSPDGTKMYGSIILPGRIYQYNMCAGSNADIANSGIQIADVSGLNLYGGSLQLGPDKKIYCGHQYTLGLNKSISVINNPNELGAACNFVPQAVSLGTRDSYIGLPSFPSYYFNDRVDTFNVITSNTTNCLNANFNALVAGCFANMVDSVVWNFNDIASGSNNRATSTTPSHLFTSAGTYNVQLILYYPCSSDTVLQNVTVVNCLCTASAGTSVVTNASCSGGTGIATVSISNGSGGTYTYSWAAGQSAITNSTTQTINNLAVGNYTVTIIDGSCSSTSTVVITEPLSLSSGVTSTNASCGLANGTATSVPSGGNTGAYTYNWSNGFTTSTGSQINNLSAQTYSLTVTDSKGCTVTTAVTISASAGINTSNGGITNALCFGTNTGSTTVNLSGGTIPYTYSWSTTTTGTTTTSKITLNNVGVGVYTITVTDANACSATYTATITEPAILTSAVTTVNGSCNSGGSITAATSGGTAAYTYLWSNGASAITTNTSNQLTNLSTQNYTLTITDSNGCTSTTSANINNGVGVGITGTTTAAPNCFGENTGSATISATSGASLYTYNWSNGASTITTAASNQELLTSNTYTITVTDNNLCSATTVVTITSPLPLTAQILTTNTSCGLNNGTLEVNTAGGSSPYSYSWSAGGQTSMQITAVAAGLYTITVTDNNGCTATSTTTVNASNALTTNITPSTTSIVEGNSTAVLIAGAGNTYVWKPANSLSCNTCQVVIAAPTSTTTYTLIASDLNGCVDSVEVTIKVSPSCLGNEEDVFIANVFSPNGDGQNDILYIKGNGLENIYWSIFDRWGNRIFETRLQSDGWDGTLNGNPMGTGTYVYYLKATCKKTNLDVILKGNVAIIR